MNLNDRLGGPRRPGPLATVAGLLSVLVGSLVAVAGLLVVWVSLVLGALAFFGWWSWQKLRGRQPGMHLAGMLMKRAQQQQQARAQAGAGQRLREGDVIDVEVHEVEPAHQRTGRGSAERPV